MISISKRVASLEKRVIKSADQVDADELRAIFASTGMQGDKLEAAVEHMVSAGISGQTLVRHLLDEVARNADPTALPSLDLDDYDPEHKN